MSVSVTAVDRSDISPRYVGHEGCGEDTVDECMDRDGSSGIRVHRPSLNDQPAEGADGDLEISDRRPGGDGDGATPEIPVGSAHTFVTHHDTYLTGASGDRDAHLEPVLAPRMWVHQCNIRTLERRRHHDRCCPIHRDGDLRIVALGIEAPAGDSHRTRSGSDEFEAPQRFAGDRPGQTTEIGVDGPGADVDGERADRLRSGRERDELFETMSRTHRRETVGDVGPVQVRSCEPGEDTVGEDVHGEWSSGVGVDGPSPDEQTAGDGLYRIDPTDRIHGDRDRQTTEQWIGSAIGADIDRIGTDLMHTARDVDGE